MAVNAHRVLNGSHEHAFINRIRLPDDDRKTLREVRDEIRTALKQLRDWTSVIEESVFLKDSLRASDVKVMTPKFRMQGSFSYHTVNNPAQNPPQEVDLDDGMFLPVSFLEKNGGKNPAIVSAAYFAAVERILAPLCNKNGWQLITDKASCVRVQVNNRAHVDVALYAIPDGEFETFVEMASRMNDHLAERDLLDSAEFTASAYRGLPADQIVLAHREIGWMASDPRKLEDWFTEAVKAYGDQVRTVSRYLKAWRDNEWETSRLASIALMYATVSVFENPATDRFRLEGRDDLALLAVAEMLPDILRGEIPNPVVQGARLDQGWSEAERKEFVDGARRLAQSLDDAIHQSWSPARTIHALRERMGDRIPESSDLVQVDANLETKSALGSPSILSEGLFKSPESGKDREAVKLDGEERYA